MQGDQANEWFERARGLADEPDFGPTSERIFLATRVMKLHSLGSLHGVPVTIPRQAALLLVDRLLQPFEVDFDLWESTLDFACNIRGLLAIKTMLGIERQEPSLRAQELLKKYSGTFPGVYVGEALEWNPQNANPDSL